MSRARLAGLLLLVLAGRAFAYEGGAGFLRIHAHGSTTDGGATLNPTSLTVSSKATFNGSIITSSTPVIVPISIGVNVATVTTANFTNTTTTGTALIGINAYSGTKAVTLNYSSGLSSNTWTLVGSFYGVQVDTVSFTNVISSVAYMGEIESLNSGGAAKPILVSFNHDWAQGNTNYTSHSNCIGACASFNVNGTAGIQICGGLALPANESSSIRFYFRSELGRPKSVMWHSSDNVDSGAAVSGGCDNHSTYEGAALPTEFDVGMNQSSAAALADYRINVYARIGFDNTP